MLQGGISLWYYRRVMVPDEQRKHYCPDQYLVNRGLEVFLPMLRANSNGVNVPSMMMRGCTSITEDSDTTASSSSIETTPEVLVPKVIRYMSSMRLTFEIQEDSSEKIYPPILEVCPTVPACTPLSYSSPSMLLKPLAKMLRQFIPWRFAFQNHERGVLYFLHLFS